MDITRRPSSGGSIAAPKPAPAAAMHSRTTPSRVIDLRVANEPSVIQTAHHTPAAAPKATAVERHMARFTDRFDRAKRFGRSEHISKFGPTAEESVDKFGNPTLAALMNPHAQASATSAPIHEHHAALAATSDRQTMPHLTSTQHEAMAHLVAPAATRPAQDAAGLASWHPHMKSSSRSTRALTTLAAFALMSGYIWLQNYPKLALQSANNRAGLAASLPGYVPSSYNLAHTDTSPGLVTLKFSSPSAPEALMIAQHRTTWDSSSLLDNFVSKHADDYATFQGQGLTVYLYGDNKATWINHGIWYSIEGAARLSREQILKIAYSL